MRACEGDRCDLPATVDGRWCERHGPAPVDLTDGLPHAVPPEGVGSAILARVPTESAQEAPTDLSERWLSACEACDEAEMRLMDARGRRVMVLEAMRSEGMSLGDIAEVTGLTRQRIGQLLR